MITMGDLSVGSKIIRYDLKNDTQNTLTVKGITSYPRSNRITLDLLLLPESGWFWSLECSKYSKFHTEITSQAVFIPEDPEGIRKDLIPDIFRFPKSIREKYLGLLWYLVKTYEEDI